MAKPAKDMPKRKCRYCKGDFKPERAYPVQKFCSDSHRKMFHKYGTLPYDKMLARAEKIARQTAIEEIAALRVRVEMLERAAGLRSAQEAERNFERDVLNGGAAGRGGAMA